MRCMSKSAVPSSMLRLVHADTKALVLRQFRIQKRRIMKAVAGAQFRFWRQATTHIVVRFQFCRRWMTPKDWMKSWRHFWRGEASLFVLNLSPCEWLGTRMIRMGDVEMKLQWSNELRLFWLVDSATKKCQPARIHDFKVANMILKNAHFYCVFWTDQYDIMLFRAIKRLKCRKNEFSIYLKFDSDPQSRPDDVMTKSLSGNEIVSGCLYVW